MRQINIIDIIQNPNAIIHKYGIMVYNVVKEYIVKDKNIVLSFKGLKNLTSGFCNASIGKLYLDYPQKASRLISFDDLDNDVWIEKIKDAIHLAENPEVSESYAKNISELFVD